MTALLLALHVLTAAGLIYLYWRMRRRPASGYGSEEEAQAEAFLANTVERLLHDLQESAQRATAGLSQQTEALEALMSEAETRVVRPPERGAEAGGAEAPLRRTGGAEAPLRRTGGGALLRAAWTLDALDLARQGLPPLQIARRVGRGETEVQLVLTSAKGGGP